MISAIILWCLNIQLHKEQHGKQGKCLESYMQAVALWMLCVFLITEVLSIFHGISKEAVILSWIIIDAILLVWFMWEIKKGVKNIKLGIHLQGYIKEVIGDVRYIVLGAIGIIIVYMSLRTVPYNWDSMTYRLSRIAYWAQSGSVEHYANNSLRLIANPPLGEFVQLEIYLMSGKSDSLLNLLQCVSYLMCAVFVYAIAKKLKCNETFCFLATLLFMSMPIAFAEAINTQVDLFATVWLLIFVYFLMDFVEKEEKLQWSRENLFKACIMGLCVAWGYLTKPSVCIAMAVFCIWLLICCAVRRDKIVVLIRLAGGAFASMVVPLCWEIGRNIKTFHAISSPIAGERQLVGTLRPNYLFINFIKNLVHNFPNTGLGELTDTITSYVWRLAALVNVDLNAEVISEDGNMFMLHVPPNYGHDTAINPIIVWLMLICILWSILKIRKLEWKKLYKSYSLVAIAAFLIFCMLLRWEVYVTRYMVSFLTLLCPMIAVQLQKQTEEASKVNIRNGIIGGICCLCILDFTNMAMYHRNIYARHGADERPYGYFVNRTEEYEPCIKICQIIKEAGYKDIGICLGGDDYEYPYWALLKNDIRRMEHVNVRNITSIYIDESYIPECIIWVGSLPEETVMWKGKDYPNIIEVSQNRYLLSFN